MPVCFLVNSVLKETTTKQGKHFFHFHSSGLELHPCCKNLNQFRLYVCICVCVCACVSVCVLVQTLVLSRWTSSPAPPRLALHAVDQTALTGRLLTLDGDVTSADSSVLEQERIYALCLSLVLDYTAVLVVNIHFKSSLSQEERTERGYKEICK